MEKKDQNKAVDLMLKLFSLYIKDGKPIEVNYHCLGMNYKLTFSAENLDSKD